MPFRQLFPAIAVAVGLSACASAEAPAQVSWAPRADANLSADKAACQVTANELDMRSPREFTDGRYGAVAAMAGHIDQASVRGGTENRMRQAVFEDCMVRKGWTPK
jgi:hypothetical protein